MKSEYSKNILGMQTHISNVVLNTIPNRYEFDKHQYSRIAYCMAEEIEKKIKFTWTNNDEIDSKCLKGEVVVLSVDEYKQLIDELETFKEEHLRMIRERYSYTIGGN